MAAESRTAVRRVNAPAFVVHERPCNDYLGLDAALLLPFGRNAELETPDCVPQSFAGTFFRQAYSLLLKPRLFAR